MISQSAPRITGTLSEIVANRPEVQTQADATDIPGVNLEFMVTAEFPNGAWFGNYGVHASGATLRSLPTAYIGQGTAMEGGTLVRYGGVGVGWVVHGVSDVVSWLRGALASPSAIDSPVSTDSVTITESADFASGSIPSAKFIPLSSARIYKSTPIAFAYATQGRDVFNPVTNLSGFNFSFWTDARVLEIDLQTGAAGNPLGILIDGSFYSTSLYNGTPPASGNIRRQWKLTFATKKLRKLQFLNAGVHNGFAGIFIGPNDQLSAHTSRIAGRFLSIADSYGGYPYAPIPHGGPAIHLYSATRFDGAIAQTGGTGYNTPNGKLAYLDRLKLWITSAEDLPKVIHIAGGINDAATEAVRLKVAEFYQYCRDNLCDSLIISVGPWCPKQSFITGSDKYTIINGWIRDSVKVCANWIYLDTITGSLSSSWGTSISTTEPWITGSGTTGAPTGTGNADIYILPDGTHPSPAGVDYHSRRTMCEVAMALAEYR